MSHHSAESSEEVTNFVWTIVVAGGAGVRFGERKQFAKLAGRSVLDHAVETAQAASYHTVVVVPEDVVSEVRESFGGHVGVTVVAGGQTRAGSVRAGLAVVDDAASIVLVHDAARPLASLDLFERVIGRVSAGAAAVIPVVPIADSLRHVDGHVVDRSTLRAVQTPQGFLAAALRKAHLSGADATDDASVVGELGFEIVSVNGEAENRKLTEPSDLVTAEAIITSRTAMPKTPET